jgi:hypothetical protein
MILLGQRFVVYRHKGTSTPTKIFRWFVVYCHTTNLHPNKSIQDTKPKKRQSNKTKRQTQA